MFTNKITFVYCDNKVYSNNLSIHAKKVYCNSLFIYTAFLPNPTMTFSLTIVCYLQNYC